TSIVWSSVPVVVETVGRQIEARVDLDPGALPRVVRAKHAGATYRCVQATGIVRIRDEISHGSQGDPCCKRNDPQSGVEEDGLLKAGAAIGAAEDCALLHQPPLLSGRSHAAAAEDRLISKDVGLGHGQNGRTDSFDGEDAGVRLRSIPDRSRHEDRLAWLETIGDPAPR